jgi:DGQHR domain-containing protein
MNKSDMSEVVIPRQISIPCIEINQPIGTFYIASIDHRSLLEITHVDVRRIEKERDIETYLGIQRGLNNKRVKEISVYVNTLDACFPTAVILAVDGRCAEFDQASKTMTLRSFISKENPEQAIDFSKIAKVLDGQHRIEGLRAYSAEKECFHVNVSIFVEVDIAEQAYIFSTVNLAQTKVNKSLVYDLFDLARFRSPQKLCHNIAVTLDSMETSPFYKRIKRLGSATPDRENETITQATFVEGLLRYLAKKGEEVGDRDLYKQGKIPRRVSGSESRDLIFRNMMIDERDFEITDILFNYFDAVRDRWPQAWGANGRGIMLNKTNGFKALMRFLRDAYLYLVGPGEVPSKDQFATIFQRINLTDSDFTIEEYKPGTSGESKLYHTLVEMSGIGASGQTELF